MTRPPLPATGDPHDPLAHEAVRQQQLMRVLWRDEPPEQLLPWLRGPQAASLRGVQAYRAHAGALAERVLCAGVPTVAALLGAEAMAGLARALWRQRPPVDGDIDRWGDELPDFVADDPQLADLPYLADVARLDRAWHHAGRAADDDAAPQGLERLAAADPSRLALRLRPGHAVVVSCWPVHTLWAAHRAEGEVTLDDARAALAAGAAQCVRVARRGLRAEVTHVDAATARFEQALLAGAALDVAWRDAGDGFDFQPWFLDTLRHGRLAAVADLGDPR